MENVMTFFNNSIVSYSNKEKNESLSKLNKQLDITEKIDIIKNELNFPEKFISVDLMNEDINFEKCHIYVIPVSNKMIYYFYLKNDCEERLSSNKNDIWNNIAINKLSNYENHSYYFSNNLFSFVSRMKELNYLKGSKEKWYVEELSKITSCRRLARNRKIVQEFLNEEKNICWLCGTENTFLTEKGRQYFEVHHIIPYNTVSKAVVRNGEKLDSKINLSILCPNCHRKIHFINHLERKELIEKMINKSNSTYNNLTAFFDDKLNREECINIINMIYDKTFSLGGFEDEQK